MRLGELLVREGQLTREQLAQALRVQGLLGGRLGTTLLEEGLITEKLLLETLGRQRSTRTVAGSELANVPPEVVRMIPARLAERYGVVPFHLKGRTLSVASKDTGDLLKEDEIGFLTSCMVRTCVGLELRIHEALERYYRISSPERLKALARRFALQARASRPPAAPASRPASSAPRSPAAGTTRRPAPATTASPPAAGPAAPPSAPPPRTVPPPPRALPRFIELNDEDAALLGLSSSEHWAPESDEPVLLKPSPLPWLARLAAAGQQPVPAAAPVAEHQPSPAAEPTPAPPTAEATPVPATAEATPAPSTVEAESAPPSKTAGEAAAGGEPAGEELGAGLDLEDQLRQASARLRDVEIRDDIADVLLAFCRPYFRRRVILVTRKEHIVGWRGGGEGIADDWVRAIEIPVHDPSIFLGLTSAGSFWLGSLPALPANEALVAGLGGIFPKECVVLPVILRSRVVCYIYGDNLGGGVAGAPIAELRRLAAKAGLAFEVYILKNKLRML